jgi:hypothetical protein
MSLTNPSAYWDYNCGKNDFDLVVDWGITSIQRQNLRYFRLLLSVSLTGNQVLQKTLTYTPYNAPTSDPYNFPGVIPICWPDEESSGNSIFLGKTYSFIASFFILSGGVPGQEYVDEEYIFNSSTVSNNLKFCLTDELFNDIYYCGEFVPACGEEGG